VNFIYIAIWQIVICEVAFAKLTIREMSVTNAYLAVSKLVLKTIGYLNLEKLGFLINLTGKTFYES
jgi:predicted aspartyl protease